MTPAEARKLIQKAGRTGVFRIEAHCFERMDERGLVRSDIVKVLSYPTHLEYQGGERWAVRGSSTNSIPIRLVVQFKGNTNILVITILKERLR